MKRPERWLAALLWAMGILLLTALVPTFMPFAWMQHIHRELQLGELPHLPITVYLTRSLSLLYAVHGGLLIYVAIDVRRHLPVVKCLGWLAVAFGLLMLAIDSVAGMPWPWVVAEGPFIVAGGAAIVRLAARTTVADRAE